LILLHYDQCVYKTLLAALFISIGPSPSFFSLSLNTKSLFFRYPEFVIQASAIKTQEPFFSFFSNNNNNNNNNNDYFLPC
jgi:hypothetical protein